MDKAEILENLGTKFELPVDELAAARTQLDQLAPTFLDLLDRAGQGEQLSDEDAQRMFFGVHLLGEAGDQRLYRPLIRLLTQSPEIAAQDLGDGFIETGQGILINVADTDPEPLLTLARQTDIEYPTGDIFRSLAVGAYAYLVAAGRFNADQAEANLGKIAETFEADLDMSTAHAWITAVVALGFTDLVAHARQRMRDDPAGAPIMTVEEIDDLIERAKTRPGTAVMVEEGFEPFDDLIATMSGWAGFSDEAVQNRIAEASGQKRQELDRDEIDPFLLDPDDPLALEADAEVDDGPFEPREVGSAEPLQRTNPNRQVGRNDPCPCGSGKKYKKCCLK